ncbi:hypothetical protein ACFUCV_11695 [Specibacter sp. NPDC057265]|uniref:hypothetical protein n=1 Tax=Specibacter sp. NPDC057265 TaxID=3346075 RepID=UPI003626F6B4
MNSRPISAIVLTLLFSMPTLAGCSLFDPQRNLTLHDVVNSEHDGPDVTTQAEDISETACASPLDCVEAYSTAEANYFRFESRKSAEEYGSTVKDGFVVNYIVMDFAGKDAPVEKQLWAMQGLAGTWNDYEGDFPDRR